MAYTTDDVPGPEHADGDPIIYDPALPLDDQGQVERMLSQPVYHVVYALDGDGAYNDLRRLADFHRDAESLVINASMFASDDSEPWSLRHRTRDEYWELMYAAARVASYLDAVRAALGVYHKTLGERLDPQPVAEGLLDA